MEDDVKSIGEDALVDRLCRQLSGGSQFLVGPGDDCAVLPGRLPGELLLLKTDAIVESIHFSCQAAPERVGWKAAARAVSDLAAMGGGIPRQALVTLFSSPDRAVSWLEGVYRGLQRCAARFEFEIVGGETARLPDEEPGCILSVCLLGDVAEGRCILRSGARVGDELWVTGSLGGSLETGRHLDFVPRLEQAHALAGRGDVHALMDLSDGLAKDLPRLARASGVGFQLDREAVPVTPGFSLERALTDGEDYELLFTLPSQAPPPEFDATRIGAVVARSTSDQLSGGWDHFPAENGPNIGTP